jgi:ribosomal protein S27AE
MDQRYYFGFLIIAGAIGVRIAMHFFDKSRIKDEVETRLGRVVSITWNPFGRGWFFEKNERHYDVTYVDRSGQTITTACKTSLFTGVYWADGPQLSEPPPRIMSRHLCAKCGYSIQMEWRACPNCGKATEFA